MDKYLLPIFRSSGYFTEHDKVLDIFCLKIAKDGEFLVASGKRFHALIVEGKNDFSNRTVLGSKDGKSGVSTFLRDLVL